MADLPSASGFGAMTAGEENSAPVAMDDLLVSDEDFIGDEDIDVLGNDADPDGDSLEVVSIDASGAIGQWTLSESGMISYSGPTNSAGDPYDYLRPGESVIETIVYTVSDGKGGTDTGTLSIGVSGLNDAPRTSNDRISVPYDATITSVNVLENDSDPEGGNLTVDSVDNTGVTGAAFMIGSGVYYNPNGQFNGLTHGQIATDTFTYTVSDGEGGSSTATVTVTINGPNQAPTANNQNRNLSEDAEGSTNFNVLSNDSDPDGDVLGVTEIDTSGAIGDWRINYSNGIINPPPPIVPIGPINPNPPIGPITPIGPLTPSLQTAAIGTSPINVSPVDDITIGPVDDTVIGPVDDVIATPIRLLGTSIRLASTEPFQYLKSGESVQETIVYTISDGNGGSDQATLTVTVQGANDAPTARDETIFVPENHSISTVTTLISADDPDGDPLQVLSIDDDGALGAWRIQGNISVTFGPSLEVFDYLKEGETYTDTVTYTVSDGNGGEATGTLTAVVLGENDAPDANADLGQQVSEDAGTLEIDVLANDTDAEGDMLRVISVDSQTTDGVVSINDGKLYYTPGVAFQSLNAGEIGSDSFTYVISDGNGGTSATTVTIDVIGANEAPGNSGPAATDDAPAPISENAGATVIDVLANDTDPAGAALTVTGLDSGGTIGLVSLGEDGMVRYDPDGKFNYLGDGQTATDSFSYFVSDGNGGVAEATATITIAGAGAAAPTGFTGGDDVVDGSEGADVFAGRPGDDRISGRGGEDVITGGAGNDIIYGDAGNDELRGNSGEDVVYGGEGDDQIFGGGDVDELFGEAGDDTIVGVTGDDLIYGGDGDDNMFGRADNDTLDGGDGDDRLTGNQGDDTLLGGAGRDLLLGSGGDDVMTGGAGPDVFIFQNERGADVITDFETGVDHINFANRLYGDRPLAFTDLVLIQDGDDAIVKDRGLEIRLEGVNAADLSEGDFIF